MVKKQRVDGVFIVGSPYDMGMIKKLVEMKFPFVLVGVDSVEEGIDSVYAEPGDGVRLGFRYLVETGHRDICFVNCPKSFRSSYERIEALQGVAHELGVSVKPEWILDCEQNNGKGGYDTFKAFWEKGNHPDAILAANGYLAKGVMRFLYEQHIRIPDDISVVAYEDSAVSGYATPALTTVNIHKEQMGEIAAHCLLERIQNPDKAVEKIVVQADLVIRESVRAI